jgi:cytochrome c-type biogenesis protein CcmH
MTTVYKAALIACAMLAAAVVMPAGAWAVMPDEILKDPALESRARELSDKLRCVVCQNQTIDESNAPLARDLRVLVRERLVAGDTDEQAMGYIVNRYGNFVLLKPPLQLNTLLLWLAPLIIAAIAIAAFISFMAGGPRRVEAPPAALGEDEKRRLNELLK